MDRITPECRSRLMSRVKNKNTKPEIVVRKFLHANGYRFRLHRRDLPGKPDIVLPKFQIAIFVNGCFWHGHENCARAKLPATNQVFWEEKIKSNKARDEKNIALLKEMQWRVVVIWQCQTKKLKEIRDHLAVFLEFPTSSVDTTS